MSHNVPKDLKYTKNHEWAKIEGDTASIGITDFAQEALGDIVFAEFPEKGSRVEKDKAFGVVESVKSVSDLYCPLSGEVVDVNHELESDPEKINTSPYNSWMIRIKISSPSEDRGLLDSSEYENLCGD